MKELKCEQCEKVIEGMTENQADHNMLVHTITQHKVVKEEKKDEIPNRNEGRTCGSDGHGC